MTTQRTAYLVAIAHVDLTGRMLPQIHSVRIFSEDAAALTVGIDGTAMLDVYNMTGDSYEDAMARLLKVVHEMRHFAWCRPLLNRG